MLPSTGRVLHGAKLDRVIGIRQQRTSALSQYTSRRTCPPPTLAVVIPLWGAVKLSAHKNAVGRPVGATHASPALPETDPTSPPNLCPISGV